MRLSQAIYFHIILVLFPVWLTAQRISSSSESPRPQWLSKGTPKPRNASFSYRVVMTEAASLDKARAASLEELSNQMANTYQTRSSTRTDQEVRQQVSNGRLDEQQNTLLTVTFESQGQAIQLHTERVDEYWEYLSYPSGTAYRCHTLYAVAHAPNGAQFDQVSFSRQYGVRGFIRSAIVPGWGQLYKGSTAKGLFILGGEAAMLGGLIAAENLRLSYNKKIKETLDVSKIKAYSNNADNAQNIRNAFIAGAAAIYTYNLVDALVANGSKRSIVQPRKFALVPVAGSDFTGVGLAVNF